MLDYACNIWYSWVLNVMCIWLCNLFLCDAWNFYCTYHFWAFGEKTPSLLFMLRKENLLCVTRIAIFLWWRISKLYENILWIHKKVLCCLSNEATLLLNLSCALARFSLFQNILRRSMLCPLPVLHAKWWMMLMLCKMM